ncbi:amidohydrolase [Galactobacillus timonensis]|uniref:M20 metallopeptidase family protein n=1 Tax=Galactobacillus timonensis TaxID=2041840 RepID=UPI0024090D42|nr:amidohydrolase [Galactobacillus timonensis]MDD6370631.1 amidohydrolase [Galactobacillus timonensis]
MNELEELLYREVLADQKEVVALRRWFHAHPELSTKEYGTQKKIEEELRSYGLEPHETAGTGVWTVIRGEKGEGKTLVLRADIDALPVREAHHCEYESTVPGVMHACGHDAQTSALLRASKILNEHRDRFPGKIIVVFQPGEEIGYGARNIIREGVIDGADRTFAVHMASNLEAGKIALVPGPNNASADQFKITVHGHGAHIAQPHRGVDAAYIASKIVVDAQSVLRSVDPLQHVLLGIGHISAGNSYNVIAGEGIIEGTLRCFDQQVRRKILADFEKLVHNTAEQYGGSADFENRDNCAPVINDPVATREAQKTAAAVFGADHLVTSRAASMSGDNFADFIEKAPGAYAYIGTGNPKLPATMVAQHDAMYDIDEDTLRYSEGIYVCYAADYLNGLVSSED